MNRKIFWFLLLLGASFNVLDCHGVVCRASAIVGFSSEKYEAAGVLSAHTTSNIKRMEIYLTTQNTPSGKYIYAHSNFLSEGAEYPTKLAEPASQFDSLQQIIGNLVYTNGNDYRKDVLHTADEISNIKIFVSPGFFNSEGDPLVSLSGPQSLQLKDRGHREVQLLPNQTNGPPPFLAVLSPNVRQKYRPQDSPTLLADRLSKASLAKDKFSILNLIGESPVETALLAPEFALHTARVSGSLTEESLFSLIRANEGKVLAMMFHCDGTNLIVNDPAGTNILTVALAKVSEVARNAKCALIGLGCASASANVPVGALEAFDPVKAVESLRRALSSSNFAEFAETLSGGSFRVVFDPPATDLELFFRAFEIKNENGHISDSEYPMLAGVIVLPGAQPPAMPPAPPSAALPPPSESNGSWYVAGISLIALFSWILVKRR